MTKEISIEEKTESIQRKLCRRAMAVQPIKKHDLMRYYKKMDFIHNEIAKQIIQEVRKHDRERLIKRFKQIKLIYAKISGKGTASFKDIEHIIQDVLKDE